MIINVLVAFHMQRAFQPQHTFFATACFPLAAVRRTNSTRALVHFLSLFRSLNVWVRESCIFDVNGLSSAHNVNYNVVQPTTDTHGRGHHMRVVCIALHQIRRDNRPKTTKYFALPTFFPFFARNRFSCAWILCRWQNTCKSFDQALKIELLVFKSTEMQTNRVDFWFGSWDSSHKVRWPEI